MELTLEFTGSRIPLLAGVQDTSTPRVSEKIKAVSKMGYKNCVVTPAVYIPSKTASEHLRHFGACVEAADIEIIPYNIPQLTQSVIAVETVCDMAKRGWIHHIKDSEGNLESLKAMVKGASEYGLGVLCGNDPISGEALLAGASGLVSGTANIVPEMFLNLYTQAKAGKREKVQQQLASIVEVMNKVVLSGPAWLPPLKVCRGAPERRRVGDSNPADCGYFRRTDCASGEAARGISAARVNCLLSETSP